jgi:uncharacterized membrane protein
MLSRQLPTILFLAMVVCVATAVVLMWPHLPARLATHFNAAGAANGWSSKDQLLKMLLSELAPFLVLFVAAGWFRRLPDRFMNLPNKEYWLAPARREATFAAFRDWMRWFLIVVFGLLAFMMLEVLRENLAPAPRLDLLPPWLMIPLFLVPVFGMIGWLFWRFRSPSNTLA